MKIFKNSLMQFSFLPAILIMMLGYSSKTSALDVSDASKIEDKHSFRFCHIKGNFGVSAEFLYWSTNFNLPFGIIGLPKDKNFPQTGLISNIQITDVNAKLIRVPQDFSPGTRLTLAYFPNYDQFDVKASWTYYENHPHISISKSNMSIDAGTFSNVNVALQLVYNIADLELGKTYSTKAKMFLRPFCGVRAGFLNQSHRLYFSGVSSTTLTGLPDSPVVNESTPARVYLDQDVWSVGPRIGLDGKWFRFKGFSVLTKLSTSLLYGKAMLKSLIKINTADPNGSNDAVELHKINLHITDNYFQLFPNLDLFLGISWEYCFSNKQTLEAMAGWETNYWWSVSNLAVFDRGISMQGLTAGFGYKF